MHPLLRLVPAASALVVLSLIAIPAYGESVQIDIDQSEVFPNEWIVPQTWPPTVTVELTSASSLSCPEQSGDGMGPVYQEDTLLGWPTCIATAIDGAAGSTYHESTYTVLTRGKRVTIQWTMRRVNCDNYDQPTRGECQEGQSAFGTDLNSRSVALTVLSQLDLVAEPSSFAPFNDVPADHIHADAIAYLKHEGIVEGYGDNTFRPDSTINRAEFTKILVATFYPVADCSLDPGQFPDVANGQWFAVYVCVAASEGWVRGYPDGTFRPGNAINFAESAKILVKAFGLEASSTIPACEGDCPWYRDYVLMLEMKGAIPTSINAFDQNITRGEMAEMIFRLKTGNNDKPSRTYEELVASGDVEYVVRYNFESNQLSDEPFDGEIIARDVYTGKETVLVSSVKKALPELHAYDNLTLKVFAQPDGSDVVIFKSVLMDTDNSSGVLYSFDLATERFTKMRMNDEYDGFYDGSALSPDQRHIVWTTGIDTEGETIGFVPNLMVASLVDDSSHRLVLLDFKNGETFNGGEFALSSAYDIEWIDDKAVRYAVYDQKKKDGEIPSSRAFIEYRTVTLD